LADAGDVLAQPGGLGRKLSASFRAFCKKARTFCDQSSQDADGSLLISAAGGGGISAGAGGVGERVAQLANSRTVGSSSESRSTLSVNSCTVYPLVCG
jgi:hypothetical protein